MIWFDKQLGSGRHDRHAPPVRSVRAKSPERSQTSLNRRSLGRRIRRGFRVFPARIPRCCSWRQVSVCRTSRITGSRERFEIMSESKEPRESVDGSRSSVCSSKPLSRRLLLHFSGLREDRSNVFGHPDSLWAGASGDGYFFTRRLAMPTYSKPVHSRNFHGPHLEASSDSRNSVFKERFCRTMPR